MHNLSGAFVRQTGQIQISNEKLFSFIIQFSSKERKYYTNTSEACEIWVHKLKVAIGYKSFFDFYDMFEDIGEENSALLSSVCIKNQKKKLRLK